MNGTGHLELQWAVDAIRTGARARRDLGDISDLIASIREHGLLQPLTVSPDGILLCGARRLAALRKLGIKHVQVWIRAGISTRLQRLLAEQDENTLHQPLRPTEAAALYREVRQLLAEEAARRQEATRFGGDDRDGTSGSGAANLAAPSDRTTRTQAARLVTGAKSYTTLERVGEIQRIADDPEQTDAIRQAARDALERMDQDGKVFGHYRHAKALATGPATPALTALAQSALERIALPASGPAPEPGPAPGSGAESAPPLPPPGSRSRPVNVRAFLLVCDELARWPCRFDPAVIGPALSAERWFEFEDAITAGVAFLNAAREARIARPRDDGRLTVAPST